MRAPLSWLNALCDSGMEPRELAERLSMTGTEVERVHVLGAEIRRRFLDPAN